MRSGRRSFRPRSQFAEGLRRGDFVHQVQIDIKDRGGVGAFGSDDVRIPNFLE